MAAAKVQRRSMPASCWSQARERSSTRSSYCFASQSFGFVSAVAREGRQFFTRHVFLHIPSVDESAFDKPKNTNNAYAAQFVVLCMVKGAVARSAAQLQASIDASNRSFSVIKCECQMAMCRSLTNMCLCSAGVFADLALHSWNLDEWPNSFLSFLAHLQCGHGITCATFFGPECTWQLTSGTFCDWVAILLVRFSHLSAISVVKCQLLMK